jgi:DNA-binding response OmpR family regulator
MIQLGKPQVTDLRGVSRNLTTRVIVLDVMLPDRSGYLVLRQLRDAGVRAPVLLISANGSETERAEGLNQGGDGYLAIPFSFGLLVAQLRALARRYRGSWRSSQKVQIGELHIDPETGVVTFRGQAIRLSPRECELLHALASRPDTVVAKRELGRLIWGPNRSTNNNVEAHIGQVRRKLYAVGAGELVRTVRGHGYMIASHATEEVQEPRIRATA